MPHTRLRPTYSFDEDRLAQLRAVVPEAFADGKIDWDTLRNLLGDAVEDPAVEHFGLSWPGKREARRLASRPSRGALIPVPGKGVNEDTTRNIFVEGENLEVLKLLLRSYVRRISLIYIDPPYNTGEDFIYKDDFVEPLVSYLRRTEQSDEEGLVVSNPKSSGRFHSNWLGMMYPRLRIARDLLAEDGAIWISISDEELPNLLLMCNEIFGEENQVATFIWEKRTTRENRKVFSNNHDYIVCYAKDKEVFQVSRNLLPLTDEALARYSNPDNDPRGDWQSVSLNAQAGHATPSQFYEIVTPSGRRLSPPSGRCWVVTKERFRQLTEENRIWFGSDGNNVPRIKLFLAETNPGLTPHTLWKADEVGTTDSAKRAVMSIFDGRAVFDTPKPVDLIKRIIRISTNQEDIVLDFFAGSATTAQAALELSHDERSNRSFIQIQLPERVKHDSDAYALGMRSVADIGKERIRRVIGAIESTREEQFDLNSEKHPLDLAFRVYRLDRSHFKPWTDFSGDNVAALQAQFDAFESPLVDGWKPDDLLVEIMLIEGFPLDSTVTRQSQFSANDVRLVESDFHEHRLWVCLDQRVELSTVSALALADNDVFICLDSALDDETKLRLSDQGKLKTI